MKRFFSCLLLFTAFITTALAQDQSTLPSPPAQNTFNLTNGTKITINYSQPGVKGRTIGKEIAPYGKVWRTGANKATTIDISQDVTLEGQSLKAGKYSIYSIPGETEWTIIINKKTGQSGTEYNEADDVMRVKVKPIKNENFVERMSFGMNKNTLVLQWGNVTVPINVK